MNSSKRGYCLTPTGLKKVENARLGYGEKLSWEKISFMGCLDRTTVSKAINGNAVDLRSLKKLFFAVSLKLSEEDYCSKNSLPANLSGGYPKTRATKGKELLIKAAEDLEKAAYNESSKTRKQELLNRAKELRTAQLAD